MLRNIVALSAVLLIAVGCASSPPPMQWQSVPHGMIKTEGVTITATDGSFVLKSGETFRTPFASNTFLKSGNVKYEVVAGGELVDMMGYYRICRACKDVRVKVPGQDTPLYGMMIFSNMHPNAYGPGSRSYLIEIPDRYIREATDGRVSMVVEWVDLRGFSRSQAGWVLWLSDMPLR